MWCSSSSRWQSSSLWSSWSCVNVDPNASASRQPAHRHRCRPDSTDAQLITCGAGERATSPPASLCDGYQALIVIPKLALMMTLLLPTTVLFELLLPSFEM